MHPPFLCTESGLFKMEICFDTPINSTDGSAAVLYIAGSTTTYTIPDHIRQVSVAENC